MLVLESTVALAEVVSVLFALAPLPPATVAFTEFTLDENTLLLLAVTSTVSAESRPPPTIVEVVELSVVLPSAASPETSPPLPEVLDTSFSSVPFAETLSVPVSDHNCL